MTHNFFSCNNYRVFIQEGVVEGKKIKVFIYLKKVLLIVNN